MTRTHASSFSLFAAVALFSGCAESGPGVLGADAGAQPTAAEELVLTADLRQHPALGTGLVRATADGLSVRSQDFELGLRLTSFGRRGSAAPVAEVAPVRDGARWLFSRRDHVEWATLDERGLEHGVDVPARPPGVGPLELRVRFVGLSPRLAGDEVRLVDASGRTRARYSGLLVLDAGGRALPSHFELEPGQDLALVVDDAGAAYPIVVDPILWSTTELGAADLLDCAGAPAIENLTARSDLLLAGAPTACVGGASLGAVLVYDRVGNRWSERTLLSPPVGASAESFGARSAAWDSLVAVASSGRAGVELFSRAGPRFLLEADLVLRPDAPVGVATPDFGAALAVGADVLFVAAPGLAPDGVEGAGAVFVHRPEEGVWRTRETLTLDPPVADGAFGRELATSGEELAVVSSRGVHLFAPALGGTRMVPTHELLVPDVRQVTLGARRLLLRRSNGEVRAFVRDVAGGVFVAEETLMLSPATGGGVHLAVDADRFVVDVPGGLRTYAFVGGRWTDEGAVDGAPTSVRALALVDTQVIAVDGAGRLQVLRRVATDGTACVSGVECESGFCVDGVCCESACGGEASDCQACSVAAGSSTDGRCEAAAISTECRSTVGACDLPETCDGVSLTCPVDLLAPSGAECRPVAGPCDIGDSCSGSSPFCPRDDVKAVGAVCRPAAGVCDFEERCDGIRAVCPTDRVEASGVSCRALDGPCDVEELCDGVAPRCPADGFAPFATVCRPAAADCDAAERCSGSGAACPADGFAADGAPCQDGDACTLEDVCRGGLCQPGPLMCEAPPPITDPEPEPPSGGGGCGVAGSGPGAGASLLLVGLLALARRREKR